jgi:lysophospholipase L1-like esterase
MRITPPPRPSTPVRKRVPTRNLVFVPLLIMLMICSLSSVAASVPSAVGLGTTYLTLGNSLTTGTEAEANNDGAPGYPTYLYNQIKGTSSLQFKLLGVDAETSTSMRAAGGQLDQALSFLAQERAAGNVVSPITLDIGGNDMVAVLQGQIGADAALSAFRTNFSAILDALVGAITVNGQRTGDLAVMTYYNPYPGVKPPLYPIDTDAEVAKFNAVITEEAAKREIAVVPVFEAFVGKPRYVFTDLNKYNPFLPISNPANQAALDYHPTALGHQVLATTFARTLGYVIPSAYVPVVFK